MCFHLFKSYNYALELTLLAFWLIKTKTRKLSYNFSSKLSFKKSDGLPDGLTFSLKLKIS